MSTISSVGIGSGLDANSIITKLVELEKQPLTSLKAKASVLGAQLSAYGSIKSQVASLGDVAIGLGTAALWNPLSVSSTNTAAVTATATGVPAKASYSVEVQQLARGQSVASAVQATDASIGTGTLTIELGTWATGMTGFTPGSAAAVSVAVVSGSDTLSAIASKINDAAAGVVATVITDSTGQRLSLRSSSTGEVSGFRVQVTDDDTTNTDNAGLSRLGFDPQTGAFGMGTTALTTVQALDAKATLNGVPVTSSSNTFAGLVPGLSIKVAQVTTAAAEVAVSQDIATIQKTITSFVEAFNVLSKTLTEGTKYDAAKAEGALFQGDSSTVGLGNALRSLVGSATTGAAYSRLSDLGISMQRDGTLLMDSAKLGTALTNVEGVKAFFTIKNANAAESGFGVKLKTFTQGLLAATGAVVNKTTALQSSVTANTKEQQKVTDRAAAVETRLRRTYSALDGKMASLNALSTYVTQQVAQWNKSTA
jgi:flagellar hook-associated protein 2